MKTISLADAKTHFSKVVESAVETHERTAVTKNGTPAVVIISVEDLEALEETIAVLSDSRVMAAIREAEASNPADDASLEDVEGIVAARRKRQNG